MNISKRHANIFRVFGKENQIEKTKEEFSEITKAFIDWFVTKEEKHFKILLDEYNDLGILLEQLSQEIYHISLNEIKEMKEFKLTRTIDIIDKMKENSVDEYERIRNGE